MGCRDGYRDQLRLQGDQETQRAREHILSLVNRKNSMGWWVREGQSLARYRRNNGGKREMRAATGDRGQQLANSK